MPSAEVQIAEMKGAAADKWVRHRSTDPTWSERSGGVDFDRQTLLAAGGLKQPWTHSPTPLFPTTATNFGLRQVGHNESGATKSGRIPTCQALGNKAAVNPFIPELGSLIRCKEKS